MAANHEERAAATRERLVEAATSCVATNGVDATSFRMVADRAGTSPASISYHFGSKLGLFEAVLDHARLSWARPLFAEPSRNLDGLLNQVDSHLKVITGEHGRFLAVLLEDALTVAPEYQVLAREFFDGIYVPVRQAASRGTSRASNSGDLAMSVLGSLCGMHLQWRLDARRVDIKAGHLALAQLLRQGYGDDGGRRRFASALRTWRSVQKPRTEAQPLKRDDSAVNGRERILVAAGHLFSSQGYRDTSFEDIERKSAVSRGSILWHFGSKAGLLLAVVDELALGDEGWTYWAENSDTPGIESLQRMLAQAESRLDSSSGRLFAMLQQQSLLPESVVRDEYANRYDTLRSFLAAWWRATDGTGRKVKPVDFAVLSLGAISGINLLRNLWPDRVELNGALGSVYALIATAVPR